MTPYREDDVEKYDDDPPDDDYEQDDEDDDDDTDPCPYCGEPIHFEAVLCPHCDRYLSKEDAPAEKKPLWIFVTAIVCLIIVVCWALF
jgi:predicted nucleic acid-binding Zn ribbon protein